jgi:mono/diheme cytochrome c family protein
MNNGFKLTNKVLITTLLCLAWSPSAWSKDDASACVELGALAYDDWTSIDGGGSGMPAGETYRDYVRCKSCHGWDRLGLKGGYVRRTRTAERPNAGYGDIDNTSRDIAPGMGDYYHIYASEVRHAGIGRSYEDGSGSWVPLGDNPTAEEVAAHTAGFTLGNQHPDFSTSGVNAGDKLPTQEQVDCIVAFVNYGDSDPKFYFFGIDTYADPVWYNIHPGANAAAGKAFYEQNCHTCHGDPAEDYNGMNGGHPEGGMLAYLRLDGKYSEFVHKARWGVPDTIMTRSTIGTPNSQNMIDVMLYLQESIQSDFVITNGISGTWYDPARDGEGFMIDVAKEGIVAVSYYTYDTQGRQMWVIGSGTTDGNVFQIDFEITEGGIYGTAFDPLLVNHYPWGSGIFTFSSCYAGMAEIIPNENYADEFEALTIYISRLTLPESCGNE